MMLESYANHKPKPSTKAELREVLQSIWNSLPQDRIDRAILGVRKRLRACVSVEEGHFEHALRKICSQIYQNGPFQGPHNEIP